MDTKGGKPRVGGDGGVLNWAIGIDMYTLMFIKLMNNKNLLYKKINKIKLKNLKKTKQLSKVYLDGIFFFFLFFVILQRMFLIRRVKNRKAI